MPAVFSLESQSPTNNINFGPVPLGDSLLFVLIMQNTGDVVLTISDVQITQVTGVAGDFTIDPSWTTSIVPGGTGIAFVAFTPNAPYGTFESATLLFVTNATQGVTQYTLTGTAARNTDAFLQVVRKNPSGPSNQYYPPCINFGVVQVGTPVRDTLEIFIYNPTTSSLLATLTPLVANGYSIYAQAGANPIAPGGSILLTLQLDPTTSNINADDFDALVVTVPGQTYTTNIEATYTTDQIISAFSLTDNEEAMLLGFFNADGTVTMLQADPTDLNTEEITSASRQHDFEAPDLNKTCERVLVRYERLGEVTFSVSYTTVDPTGQTGVTQTRTTETATDGLLNQILFDGSITGQLIQLLISRAANAGPLSIAIYTPYVDVRGEVIEGT